MTAKIEAVFPSLDVLTASTAHIEEYGLLASPILAVKGLVVCCAFRGIVVVDVIARAL